LEVYLEEENGFMGILSLSIGQDGVKTADGKGINHCCCNDTPRTMFGCNAAPVGRLRQTMKRFTDLVGKFR